MWFPDGQIWKSSIAYVDSLSDGGREGALVMVLYPGGQIMRVFVTWRSDHEGVCGLAVKS